MWKLEVLHRTKLMFCPMAGTSVSLSDSQCKEKFF